MVSTSTSERRGVKTEYGESKLPARLLSVTEVANFLSVHSSTVRRWREKGLLKSYAIGLRHNLRFKQEDVLDFLQKSHEKSPHGPSLNSSSINKGEAKDQTEGSE